MSRTLRLQQITFWLSVIVHAFLTVQGHSRSSTFEQIATPVLSNIPSDAAKSETWFDLLSKTVPFRRKVSKVK